MKNQYASTTLIINLQAVRNNYLAIRKLAANAKVAAVVKADAYGLGFKEISSVLAQEGCDIFFVANLDEALGLREMLPKADIYVLHGLTAGQEEIFCSYNISPVLNSSYQLGLWQTYALKIQKKLPCIIHFDTGMNRLGLPSCKWLDFKNNIIKPDAELTVLEAILSSQSIVCLDIKYIMSHLACSEDANNHFNKDQLLRLQSIASHFKGISLSIANSGGIFLGKDYHFDLVRPGIAIYGVNPSTSIPSPVKNVIKLTSKILQVHFIDRPVTVGYGAKRKFAAGTKLATISVGYADGYLRSLSDSGICNIDGVKVPVVGRVSMDLITLDVTEIPNGKLTQDTLVELIGDNIGVEAVAQKAGTIGYEILTSLGSRYKRVYKDLGA